jgi:hypothetical protein
MRVGLAARVLSVEGPPELACGHDALPAALSIAYRRIGTLAFRVGETGFEPATARPPAGCATRLRHSPWLSRKRATGIEPALEAWKASVQPQHFARRADFRIIARARGRVRSLRGGALLGRAGENRPVSGNYRLMQIPGVHIETLHNPTRYSYAQIEKACTLAALLNRGKLVLVEPPRSR